MVSVNIHEAKTHLSKLLQRVSSGEDVIISKAGKPLARIVPYESKPQRRIAGQDQGLFSVPDDFDSPLSDETFKLFEE